MGVEEDVRLVVLFFHDRLQKCGHSCTLAFCSCTRKQDNSLLLTIQPLYMMSLNGTELEKVNGNNF